MEYTEITKPSFPDMLWDEPATFWDEEDVFWDTSGYPDIDKPSMPVYTIITKPTL